MYLARGGDRGIEGAERERERFIKMNRERERQREENSSSGSSSRSAAVPSRGLQLSKGSSRYHKDHCDVCHHGNS